MRSSKSGGADAGSPLPNGPALQAKWNPIVGARSDTPEALQRYATVHRGRHLTTFKTFGVTTHGVWTEPDGGANRIVALIRDPPGADHEQLTRQCMTSPQFAADTSGFAVNEILDVQSLLVDPTSFSPIQ